MHAARRLIPLLALSAACASAPQTGIMAVRWTPKGGADAQPVPFSWNSHHENHGVIHTAPGPGAEHFNGRFALNDPRSGMVSGGVGQCQVNDGSAIDVQL